MLAEAGSADAIKPVRLQNIIEAQRPDGGWSGIDALLPVGNGRYLAFGSRGFTISRPASDFHATAQGLLLSSILAHPVTEQELPQSPASPTGVGLLPNNVSRNILHFLRW
jgi:hypothetical protein